MNDKQKAINILLKSVESKLDSLGADVSRKQIDIQSLTSTPAAPAPTRPTPTVDMLLAGAAAKIKQVGPGPAAPPEELGLVGAARRQKQQRQAYLRSLQPAPDLSAPMKLESAYEEIDAIDHRLKADPLMPINKSMTLRNRRSSLVHSLPGLLSASSRIVG